MRTATVSGLVLGVTLSGVTGFAQELRIGTVNIEKILRDYKKLQSHRKRLRVQEQGVRAAVNDKNKKYQELKEKRDLFAKGTPEYDKHNREMVRLKSEARAAGEVAEQELRVQAALALANSYNEVVKEIKNYAARHRYALILRFNDARIAGTNPDQVTALIAGRRLLFSKADMDLTLIILDRLNKAYEAQQQGGKTAR